jgi:outer membrane immunogenic protein
MGDNYQWGASMKKLFITGATFAALAVAPAMAADMPVKAMPMAPIFSWTGCYVGLHVGIGIDKNANDFGTAIASGATEGGGVGEGASVGEFGPFSGSVGGGVAGGQIGCNYQVAPSWVIGLEGEGLWSDMSGGATRAEDGSDPGSFSRFESLNRWAANAAFRLGYAQDRSLWYGKVGVAFGDFKYTEWHDDFPTLHSCPGGGTCSVSFTDTRTGLLLGVGWEYALTNNMSMKFEYDYINYQTANIPYPSASAAIQSFSVRDTQNIVKFGINWRLNAGPML